MSVPACIGSSVPVGGPGPSESLFVGWTSICYWRLLRVSRSGRVGKASSASAGQRKATRAQSGEELFAVAIRNGGGVLGVVSLAAPTEHAADIASEAAHQAAWLAAAALSRILSN